MHTISLLVVALIAFAANSFFCRLALANHAIDPGSFTWLRLVSGAVTLLLIQSWRGQMSYRSFTDKHSWWSGISLFGYAVCFSYAYTQLSTGTGALILFGMVQLTLVVFHVVSGNRLSAKEMLGIGVALSGFTVLMLPSAEAPSLSAAALMLVSGVCWGIFTLLGRQNSVASVSITQGFMIASVLAFAASPLLVSIETITADGVLWALLSGIFASGFGYILWYQVVKHISVLQASVSQLAVPVIAFAAGSIGLGESITLTAAISSLLVLGGITLIFTARSKN
ncbi:DMT family transporter [Vibrio europaeus]|uniref:DMT family transporter n=1 Tax=Vibrio europaeus TaxID=300876 RepID=A0A178J828_9VIBR|nr:DMT family transporter [Vibrio europaeus]MDC5705538.1 DMT family transporter [Vibrio europaeus]MDC5710817.1 DMT family transporter [Vibrio europaeus]MDC5715907.1 DMT family transporter [Vibrio europaeus]MDC5720069.1 DMT family transporter [Vibrio europaeus]MDC5724044.1 DMT family transporter [Vibrio europaeus]